MGNMTGHSPRNGRSSPRKGQEGAPYPWYRILVSVGVVLMIVVSLLSISPVKSKGAEPTPTVDEVVAQLVAGKNLTTGRLEADMDIVAKTALGSTRFKGHVDKRGDTAKVTTTGAPWFVPEQASGSLVEIDSLLQEFDLKLAEVSKTPEGAPLYVVVGTRKQNAKQGAKEGKFWIRGDIWQVPRVVATYWWGSLDVEFTYGIVQDRLVIVRQVATVHPGNIRLEVTYSNFRFEK